ncbi:MAG: ribbon-helix-helix protein, CopG family [Candidatus Korarchaeota archaeon]|nr:ribbon-helix-helix protein, CopG family [Candidatus Korarchaeota archaeon]
MSQQVSLNVDKELIDAIDALVSEGMFRSRSEAIKAALMGFIRTKNAERVRLIYEEAISEAISDFRKK